MPNVTISLPATIYTKTDLKFRVSGSAQAQQEYERYEHPANSGEMHDKDTTIFPVITVNGVTTWNHPAWPRPPEGHLITRNYQWAIELTAPVEGPLNIVVNWRDCTQIVIDDDVNHSQNSYGPEHPDDPGTRSTQITIDYPPTVSAVINGPIECQAPGELIPVILDGKASDDRGVSMVYVGVGDDPLIQLPSQSSWDTWKATVNIPSEIGPKVIHFKAVDNFDQESSGNVTATVVDTKPPEDVTVKINDKNLLMDDKPVKCIVSVTARDKASGVKRITVSLIKDGTVIDEKTTDQLDQSRNATATWSTDFSIPNASTYIVKAIAEDKADNHGNRSDPVTGTVVVQYIPQPTVQINIPPPNLDVITGTDQGADIIIEGIAYAEHSKVTDVRVILDNGDFNDPASRAIPVAPDDWSKWSKPIHIPPQGEHTITVRCSNSANNPAIKYRSVSKTLRVGVQYKSQDKDNLSFFAYFKDLLKFALDRISIKITDNGTSIERNARVDDLVRNFYQPFDQLQVDEEVLQIRVCIEVLRKYLKVMNKVSDPAAEERYRQAAYESLLTQFGISYEELRLAYRARSDDKEEQKALEDLTARLGIEPDAAKLRQLLLVPKKVIEGETEITEKELERLFGLVDTTREPLTSIDQLPMLFQWQKEYLRALWKIQDHPSKPGSTAPNLIIDPDLLWGDDFLIKEGEAFNLWKQRSEWIVDQLSILEEKENRPTGESDHDRIARLVDKSFGQGAISELLALDAKQMEGHDIADELLAKHCLGLPAFGFLIRMYKVPADQGLLGSEWDAVYSILVQAMKQRQYDSWRTQETNLTLGPDHFKITDTDLQLPEWRGTNQARRAWQETLQGRIDQQESIRQAFLTAVSKAESFTLPILREILVNAIGQTDQIDASNWLTQRLMIDVKGSSAVKTTRITQAVESLQSILSALRTDRFMEMENPAGWQVPLGDWERKLANTPYSEIGRRFDQEWAWMGSYASWNAAMRIFLYPENLLLPSLRQSTGTMTTPFSDWLDELRLLGPRLTGDAAKEFAKSYLNAIVGDGDEGGIKEIRDKLKTLDPDWQKNTFVLDDSMEEADLLKRAAAIETLVKSNDGTEPFQSYMAELFYFVPMQLAIELYQAGQYSAALDWFRTVYGYNLPVGQRKIWYGLQQEKDIESDWKTPDQWLRIEFDPFSLAGKRAIAFTRFTIISIVRCFLDYADAEFSSESGEAVARARMLYLSALDVIDSADMNLPSGDEPAVHAGYNPNPEPQALRMHAEVNLRKLRSGRNIAGMQRQITTYFSSGISNEAYGGSQLQPTPYRYSTLIDRAKQLVNLAQQMEDRYLSALEKKEAEIYNLVKARHDLNLAQVTIQLQNLRVTEADDGIALAALQKSRAVIQKGTYKQWIDGGKIQAEKDLLHNYDQTQNARDLLALADATASIGSAFASAANGGAVGWIGFSVASAGITGRYFAQMNANAIAKIEQLNSFNASYERRKKEWLLQQSLAEKDVAIANKQIDQAQDHRQIISQELKIAEMQVNHAQATVDFLANKFLNVEMYHWMSGVLGKIYHYFLQQATAIARLAENQLAFERQEKPLSVIRTDYWEAASETSTLTNTSDGNRYRRGLTGSARLLQDVYQLDQYAFETNKRKLQLSKTISLAQMGPFEFQFFRQTGLLPFATSMVLFDQDFPGHYLRLIRRVRTSVIALVPPNQGIRATLATNGLSRVTIADGSFRNVLVHRDPEMVAFTSPLNATGIFELDVQSELLLPFEGIGVDTAWIFEMPKAANPFDYGTIADVLITIEYTALHNFDYRQQVIQRLDRGISADKSFSLRNDFPDQWYELNNSFSSDQTISFNVSREDFPVNLVSEKLKIDEVLLYVIVNKGKPYNGKIQLNFSFIDGEGQSQRLGGEAKAIDGVISTRRGNANSWSGIKGKQPYGTAWSLPLAENTDLRRRITDNEVEDVVFIITYSGETPAWPS